MKSSELGKHVAAPNRDDGRPPQSSRRTVTIVVDNGWLATVGQENTRIETASGFYLVVPNHLIAEVEQ